MSQTVGVDLAVSVNPNRTFWGNQWNVMGTLVGSIAALCVIAGTVVAALSANQKKALEAESEGDSEEDVDSEPDTPDADSRTLQLRRDRYHCEAKSKIGKALAGIGLVLGLVTMCLFYQPMIEIYPGDPDYEAAVAEAAKKR